MEGATHFMEVWAYDGDTNCLLNTGVIPVDKLRSSLDITELFGHRTIAVWNIKLKPNDTNTRPNNSVPDVLVHNTNN